MVFLGFFLDFFSKNVAIALRFAVLFSLFCSTSKQQRTASDSQRGFMFSGSWGATMETALEKSLGGCSLDFFSGNFECFLVDFYGLFHGFEMF